MPFRSSFSAVSRAAAALILLAAASCRAQGPCDPRWTQAEATSGYSVYCVAPGVGGDLLVGGSFSSIAGVPANNIARWDGVSWHPIGNGLPRSNSQTFNGVPAICTLSNGNIVAGGAYIGRIPGSTFDYNGVAIWNGASWSALGGGIFGRVFSIAQMPNGDIVVAGDFEAAGGVAARDIARWNGTAWSAMNVPGIPAQADSQWIQTLLKMPNGDLWAGGGWWYWVGGGHTNRGAVLAKWNGTAWAALTPPGVTVYSLAALPNGNLVVGGTRYVLGFDEPPYLSRWNGTSWTAMSSGAYTYARDMKIGANGDLIVAGIIEELSSGQGTGTLGRWDGVGWHVVGEGIRGNPQSVAILDDGKIAAGGYYYSTSGGRPLVTIYGPPPPTVVSQPANQSGCRGGSTSFTITASGAPPLAFRWQSADAAAPWNWYDLNDGPLILGSHVAAVVSGALTQTLTLNVDPIFGQAVSGLTLRCVATDACASMASRSATLTTCAADFDDGSGLGTCDGGVTIDDLLCYLGLYAPGDVRSDVDDGSMTGAPDGSVTIDDLLFYLSRYEAGC